MVGETKREGRVKGKSEDEQLDGQEHGDTIVSMQRSLGWESKTMIKSLKFRLLAPNPPRNKKHRSFAEDKFALAMLSLSSHETSR